MIYGPNRNSFSTLKFDDVKTIFCLAVNVSLVGIIIKIPNLHTLVLKDLVHR